MSHLLSSKLAAISFANKVLNSSFSTQYLAASRAGATICISGSFFVSSGI